MYPALFTTPGLKRFAEDIDTERQAQLAKWGDQRHADGTGSVHQQEAAKLARMACQDAFGAGYGTWCHILFEEVWEALAEKDPAKLRTELIQTAAVIAAWVSDLDRRPAPEEQPAAEEPLTEVLRIVSKWVADRNNGLGPDTDDLIWDLEQAGHPLPDDEDGA